MDEIKHKFECEYCGKTYKHEGFLLKHLKSFNNAEHFPKQKYVKKSTTCTVCNKTFRDTQDLRRHNKTIKHLKNSLNNNA